MSRAIKFRVWCPFYAEMFYDAGKTKHPASGQEEYWYMLPNGERRGVFCPGGAPTSDVNTDEEALWEQFVGLQDKNGKDIYEGDIVRVQGWAMPCVVIYHFGGFACSYSWIVKDKDKEERVETANISMAYFAGAYLGHLEVVGNIHENPEMMK